MKLTFAANVPNRIYMCKMTPKIIIFTVTIVIVCSFVEAQNYDYDSSSEEQNKNVAAEDLMPSMEESIRKLFLAGNVKLARKQGI